MNFDAVRDAWFVGRRYQPAEYGSAEIRLCEPSAIQALVARLHGANVSEGDKAMQLLVNGSLVMSDTRDELRDHYEAIRMASGRVLINGLGLGCYLAAILTKPEVEHVDVVEINPDVIALVSPYFERGGRVSFIHGDALTYKWPRGMHWDCVWHDIWPNKCTDDLQEHSKLTRSFGRRSGWQGCWAHGELLRYRRYGR